MRFCCAYVWQGGVNENELRDKISVKLEWWKRKKDKANVCVKVEGAMQSPALLDMARRLLKVFHELCPRCPGTPSVTPGIQPRCGCSDLHWFRVSKHRDAFIEADPGLSPLFPNGTPALAIAILAAFGVPVTVTGRSIPAIAKQTVEPGIVIGHMAPPDATGSDSTPAALGHAQPSDVQLSLLPGFGAPGTPSQSADDVASESTALSDVAFCLTPAGAHCWAAATTMPHRLLRRKREVSHRLVNECAERDERPGAESMLSDPSPSGSGDGAAQLTEADEVAALVEGADAGVTESVKGATSDLADLFSLQLQIDTTKADIKSIEGQLRVLKEADKLPTLSLQGRIGVGGMSHASQKADFVSCRKRLLIAAACG